MTANCEKPIPNTTNMSTHSNPPLVMWHVARSVRLSFRYVCLFCFCNDLFLCHLFFIHLLLILILPLAPPPNNTVWGLSRCTGSYEHTSLISNTRTLVCLVYFRLTYLFSI